MASHQMYLRHPHDSVAPIVVASQTHNTTPNRALAGDVGCAKNSPLHHKHHFFVFGGDKGSPDYFLAQHS
jgi:hypothetical protein